MAATELLKTVLINNTNLKAYYRMESGALTTDSSGNGYTLTNNNTVGEAAGKFGGAADGGTTNTNKSFSIASTLGMSNNEARTLSIWVKMNTELSGADSFGAFIAISHADVDVNYRIGYWRESSVNRVTFDRGKFAVGTTAVKYSVNLGTTSWHHLVLTWDGTNIRGYFDGQHIGTLTFSGNGSNGYSDELRILCDSGGNNFLSATIDDIGITNSVLSADQIKELYEGRVLGEGWPQAGLVGGWHFNGNLNDFSGNNYHLTAANAPTDVAGKFNGAKKFVRASTQSVSIADASCPALEINGSQTWSFWLYPTTIGATNMCLSKASASLPYRQIYITSSNTVNFDVGSTTPGAIISDITLAANTWYYIVGVIDSVAGTISIYINAKGKSVSYTGSPGDTNGPFYIGRDNAGNYLDGIIDEVQIYNVAKDARWVRQQYALARGFYV